MGVTQTFSFDVPTDGVVVTAVLDRDEAEALYNDLGEALWGAERPYAPAGPSVAALTEQLAPFHLPEPGAPVIVGQTPGTIGGPSSPEMGAPESNVPVTSLEDEARALMAISAQYGGPTKTLEEWMEDAAAARSTPLVLPPPTFVPPPPEAHVHSQLGSGNDVGSARGGSDTQRSA